VSLRRCLSLVIILFLLLQPVAVFGASGFEIHFLDVGQADSAIVICDGQVMIIDGGNASDSSLVYSYLKNMLKVSHINYMVCTEPLYYTSALGTDTVS
jgi:competence protein ComEC